MNFLMTHNFDFNTLYYEGLEYISREDRASLGRSAKARRIKDKLRADSIEQDKQYKAFRSLHWEEVAGKLNELAEGGEEGEELLIEVPIRFIKVKIYKFFEVKLEEEFDGSLQLDFDYDSDLMPRRTIIMITATNTARQVLDIPEQKLEKNPQEIIVEDNEADTVDLENQNSDLLTTDFTEIIDLLIDQKKPFLTHNGLFDILHFYDKFIGSLPEQQKDFKQKWTEIFPELYDTKFMLNNSNQLFSHTNKHTSLGDSFGEVYEMETPEISLGEGFEAYDLGTDGASHEAGFDAYMTGVVFLRNLVKLGKKLKKIEKIKFFYFSNFLELLDSDSYGTERFSEAAKMYKNRLPLGGVKAPFNFDSGEDIYSDPTERVFHCYVFTEQKKLKEILEWFGKKFGDFNHQVVYGDTIEFFFNLLSQKEIENLSLELSVYGGRKICK